MFTLAKSSVETGEAHCPWVSWPTRAAVNANALVSIADAATDPFAMWNRNPALPQMASLGFTIGAQGVGLITIFNGAHVHTTTVLTDISLNAL